jgi:hypothetical protein
MATKQLELPLLHDKQVEIIRDTHRFRVIACGRRWGKALSIETPILTPNGFKTMGELKVGDYVFNEKGDKTKITFVSEVFKDHSCYIVEFSNGDSIVADAEHEWVVEDKNYRKSLGRAKI